MTRIGIILGSTRPGRNGEQVARWVLEHGLAPTDATFELIDLLDYPLPHLDEPLPPSMGQYQNGHTQEWAAKIASYDGYVFVTPEYNHGTSGVLKNAIDYLFAEWNNKAVGFVAYGAVGGARAIEHLRLVAGELKMADVRTRSRSPCSPTSRTSRASSLDLTRCRHSRRCSKSCWRGARPSRRCVSAWLSARSPDPKLMVAGHGRRSASGLGSR